MSSVNHRGIPFLSLARLIRLPNVFTAPPDVLAGWALVGFGITPSLDLVCVVAGSVLLYASGMIWNDWFDIDQDRRDRPARPLPSGDISVRAAFILGMLTLIAGMGLCWAINARVGLLSMILAGSILAYDGLFKSWPIAPAIMGLCRSLNLLLGAVAASPHEIPMQAWWFALASGLFITGVTLFARQEAKPSSRPLLLAGASIMLLGLLFWTVLWINIDSGRLRIFFVAPWVTGWVMTRLVLAIRSLSPGDVQRAIKTSIFSLVVCQAITIVWAGSPAWGLIAILHLLPAIILGRWLYST
ncbi:UbiA family prenyltransferase [bacterium]|nr:UbiA family prenyltransferase [bacterium]